MDTEKILEAIFQNRLSCFCCCIEGVVKASGSWIYNEASVFSYLGSFISNVSNRPLGEL